MKVAGLKKERLDVHAVYVSEGKPHPISIPPLRGLKLLATAAAAAVLLLGLVGLVLPRLVARLLPRPSTSSEQGPSRALAMPGGDGLAEPCLAGEFDVEAEGKRLKAIMDKQGNVNIFISEVCLCLAPVWGTGTQELCQDALKVPVHV